MSAERLNQKTRTLIVHKDDTGYGLTLSGDKPTRVQTVKLGGASHRAGVREGDVIIKVNGQHVMNSDHNEVVKLIQSGSYVALTVVHTSRLPADQHAARGGSLGPGATPPTAEMAAAGGGNWTSTTLDGVELRRGDVGLRSPTAGITGPQPVSDQVLRLTQAKSVETLELMIEEQTREIDELRSHLARSPSKKIREKLEDAERKLHLLTAKKGSPQHTSVDRDQTPLPPLPPTPTNTAALSPAGTPVSRRGTVSGEFAATAVASNLFQDSTPVAPPRSESLILSSTVGGGGGDNPPPPPLPARNTAPTPPPRNLPPSSSVHQPTAGLPPPPPKIPRHNSHENISCSGRSGSIDRRAAGSKTMSSPVPPPKYAVHTRTRSSPSSLEQTLEVAKSLNFDGGGGFGGTGGRSPRYETPPGTPPPPYNPFGGPMVERGGSMAEPGGGITNRGLNILTMEDDSEDEGGGVIDSGGGTNIFSSPDNSQFGVFNSLNDLIKQTAHLAVFLNYVCSNSDSAPLLFYLITDVYKQGTLKEMRKWAYEIHSSFLLSDCPLKIANLDNQTIQSIDAILVEETEREETMQKLFWKARAKARELLKFQLDDFREKLVQGMGGIFGGPSTNQLKEAEGNESRRLGIAEEILVPLLDTMVGNYESADDKGATQCSAFATVLVKSFNIKSSQGLASIEKIPMFVSKEKKKDKIFQRVSKKLTVKGHNFYLRHYDQLTLCGQSKEVIWGIGPQGYRCSNCDFDVYKKYINQVEESCPGPSQDKKKRNRTSINFLGLPKGIAEVGRIMSKDQLQVLDGSRKTSSVSPSPSMRGQADLTSFRSYTSDHGNTSGATVTHEDQADADSSTPSSGRKLNEPTPSSGRKLNNSGGASTPPSATSSALSYASQIFGSSDLSPHDRWMRPEKGAAASIKRSESAKDGAKRQQPRPYHRKHSDPSLSVASSSSSHMAAVGGSSRVSKSGSSSSSSLLTTALEQQSSFPGIDKLNENRLPRSDSSDELGGEVECPDWRKSLPPEKLTGIPKREQKRQDVINELFHTERNHVRNLRILDNVFRKPLQESGLMAADMIDRLFPNLEDVINVHQSYSLAMKQKTQRGFPVGPVGDLLEGMFQGSAGERLKEAGAKFTQDQHYTIDELKKLRLRDPKLESFLSEQERRPECRRLQLQSLLPCEHQRLVKYPLLLENLIKHCDPTDSEEFELMRPATTRTREIVESIDKQVAAAQNRHKLVEIQRNLDTSGLEKMGGEDPVCREYRHIDLTTKELLYDGNLTLNLSGENRRNKKIDLYVLLLDDSIMFLQKQDEKYVLKFHSLSSVTPMSSQRDEATRRIHSPVIKFSSLLVRTVATNKRAFFVINNPSTAESQLNELIAGTKDECDKWLRHINQAAEIYKSRSTLLLSSTGKLPRTSTTLSLHNMPGAAGGSLSAASLATQMSADGLMGVGNQLHEGPSRSQSFNDAALRRDSIQFRPLPTPPPLDTPQVETLDDKFAKLDAKDREITRALEDKHRILTEILNIPPEEYDSIVDMSSSKQSLDSREALMALMTDVDNLGRWVNDALKVDASDSTQPHPPVPVQPQAQLMSNPTLERVLVITESLRNNTRLILSMMSLDIDDDDPSTTESHGTSGGQRSHDNSLPHQRSLDIESMGSQSRPHSFISNDSIEIPSDDGINNNLTLTNRPHPMNMLHSTADNSLYAADSLSSQTLGSNGNGSAPSSLHQSPSKQSAVGLTSNTSDPNLQLPFGVLENMNMQSTRQSTQHGFGLDNACVHAMDQGESVEDELDEGGGEMLREWSPRLTLSAKDVTPTLSTKDATPTNEIQALNNNFDDSLEVLGDVVDIEVDPAEVPDTITVVGQLEDSNEDDDESTTLAGITNLQQQNTTTISEC